MYIVGIDGGGTHTRLELRDGENRTLERRYFGPFNLNAIGEEAFRLLLRQVFAGAGEWDRLCVGAAGASNPAVGQILEQELDRAGFRGRWTLCGDHQIALRGAMDTPGLALVAGTGSICFGRDAAGQTARCGGWGHLLDDGGSGYALGREVLRQAVRTADGRSRAQALTRRVYERLGLATPEELVAFVYSPGTDKAAVAALASVALELAEEDPAAGEICRQGANDLAELVRAVQARLGLEGCPIALLGGLLESPNPYRTLVCRQLAALGTPAEPLHDALWGAAQMAWELGPDGR